MPPVMSMPDAPVQPIVLERHPIVRGDFPALVFSGSRDLLGELPGELTASTMFKYALADNRIDADDDFARSPHMPLPLWPADRVAPAAGVCFVFSDESHPGVALLRSRGGLEHEHYVIAATLLANTETRYQHANTARLIEQVQSDGAIIFLGYGDQGARIASFLRDGLQIAAERVLIVDDNEDSRQRARRDGFTLASNPSLQNAAVIYSPLLRYDRLHAWVVRAREAGLPVFDNSITRCGTEHFRKRGKVMFDAAADRALQANDLRIRVRAPSLPIRSAVVVRQDHRCLADRDFPHMTSSHRAELRDGIEFDLAAPSAADPLATHTLGELQRAFVALRDRPDLSIFAARSLCLTLWPEATMRVFPSNSSADIGCTPFERILKRHIDGAEIMAASQTASQQVVLGVAAHHYAHTSAIVEIGSALGGSGILMAAATDQHRPVFYSIDPETATRHVMRWGFQQHDQADRLHQIIKTSDEAIAGLGHLHGKAGVVFIDGLHTEAATAADFIQYAPLIRTGGALLIHDCEPARYSVLRVLIERILPDQRFRPMCLVDGLTVLERV